MFTDVMTHKHSQPLSCEAAGGVNGTYRWIRSTGALCKALILHFLVISDHLALVGRSEDSSTSSGGKQAQHVRYSLKNPEKF